jgi:hypothetical protein
MSDERTILLFSYGTLLSSFGRLLEGQADAMVVYRQSRVEIIDPEIIRSSKRFHRIVAASDNPKPMMSPTTGGSRSRFVPATPPGSMFARERL